CYFNAPPLSETYTLSLHDALPILGVAAKYVFYRNPQHELLLSAGVGWDVGGTGAKKVGAESFDTVTPQLFWGKCFGDLPDTVQRSEEHMSELQSLTNLVCRLLLEK